MRTLICGGTGAIGAALVERFVEDGHEVAFTYAHSEQEATDASRRLGASAHQVDVSDREKPPSFPVDVDILIYNTAVSPKATGLYEVTDEVLAQSFDVNAAGAIRMARTCIPGMVERSYGRIVNINSIWGLSAATDLRLSYTISKFALRGVTRSLAREFARSGITANDVCPGPVDSAMLHAAGREAVSAGAFSSLDEFFKVVADNVPIGRLIQPTEVAAAVAWLASAEAGACNGVALRVDGGMFA